MFRIIDKKLLAPDIWSMNIEAPRVSKSARPGQFVIVRGSADGERIPLTIADYDADKGSVRIVIQTVGASTRKMVRLAEGDCLADFAGPLGQPSEFIHETPETLASKHYLLVAGGVGAAPVYPQAKWLHQHGVAVDVIVGARNSEMLIMTDEMLEVCDNIYIATDDGSRGFHGNVTAMMKELIDNQGKHYDEVITIGPMIMMKFVARAAAEYGLKCTASLNTLMIDGTGMCGACRVSIDGKMKFACVDGPEFDASKIDFDEAMRRQTMYREKEQIADHRCRIGLNE